MKKHIKVNGLYPLNSTYRSSGSAVYLSGVEDGATNSLVVHNPAGTEIPLLDDGGANLTLTNMTQAIFDHGIGQTVYVKFTGTGAGTDLWLESYEVAV